MVNRSAMARRTRIKFCGLVRPEDVRLAATLGVDAIGFVFYERSPRLLDLAAARELRALLPSWVAAIGLFVNAPAPLVKQYSQVLGLDAVQFHGDEREIDCHAALLDGQAYWRAIRVRSQADLLNSWACFDSAECFVLDAYSEGYGGSGESFDWSVVPDGHNRSLIVSGGLHTANVHSAIRGLRPLGVDVSTGIQGTDPRQKDPAKMESFVAAVVRADAEALKG